MLGYSQMYSCNLSDTGKDRGLCAFQLQAALSKRKRGKKREPGL